jgi:hypothetical protein
MRSKSMVMNLSVVLLELDAYPLPVSPIASRSRTTASAVLSSDANASFENPGTLPSRPAPRVADSTRPRLLTSYLRIRRRGGQHLKRLKRYLDEHHFDRVKELYFTTGRPEYDGIRAERMRLEDMARPPAPGLYPGYSVTPASEASRGRHWRSPRSPRLTIA